MSYSQFLRLRRICSEDNDFENKSKEMASLFRYRDHPSDVIQRAQERISAILVTPLFQSVQMYQMLNLPSHWC